MPAGRALAGATELAARVARGAPLALAASKRVIVESADWASTEAFARQGEIINPVFTSADAMEGAIAFAEKRAPAWRGDGRPYRWLEQRLPARYRSTILSRGLPRLCRVIRTAPDLLVFLQDAGPGVQPLGRSKDDSAADQRCCTILQ